MNRIILNEVVFWWQRAIDREGVGGIDALAAWYDTAKVLQNLSTGALAFGEQYTSNELFFLSNLAISLGEAYLTEEH